MSEEDVPPHLKAARREIGDEGAEATFRCKCRELASSCESTSKAGYKAGECYELSCSSPICMNTAWAWCKPCKRRFGGNYVAQHSSRKKHKMNSDAFYGTSTNVATSAGANPSGNTNATADHHAMEIETSAFPCPDDGDVCYGGGDKVDDASIADMSCNGFIQAMEVEMSRTFVEGDALLENEESMPPHIAALIRQCPKISMKGNEWMDEAFRDTKRAELTDIASSFSDLDNMRLFWVAEHASPPGRCGGGLRYLVARTFQNAKADAGLDVDRIPDFPEARWHIDSFIQYHSMSEPQQRRQARITKSIMDHVQPQSGTFFKDTFIPEYKDLARMYGKTGKQSLWNILPIPPVEDLDGVAYVSPIHIVKFLFANGVPVDDIVVNFGVQSDT